MITVVTPFSRKENLPFLIKVLEGKCNWVVLQSSDEPVIEFPEWVDVRRYDVTNKKSISNRLFNEFINHGVDDDTQYILLNDDDSVEEGFFDKIPNASVVVVGMKRNDTPKLHARWDSWEKKTSKLHEGIDVLEAKPEEMRCAHVGGEQFIIKGYVLKNFRYGLGDSSDLEPGDWKFMKQILYEYEPVFVPDAYVLFNYFEDGRFKSFRRKPLVLFVGDYFCAGVPRMGVSEWETNIWKSLESTNKAQVLQFHMDKYFYHTGKRGDEALLSRVEELKPDYIVLILYKPLGGDPTVITLDTLEKLSKVKIISIWGDLEAEEQQVLAKQVAPYCYKVIGTANEEIVSGLGYEYMHVPKDPRVFNNPDFKRDIDVLFNGSFGYGREERREVLQYLVDNGVNLVAGGSEGGDHFTTEEYADRYKRTKIAIGFSRARGKDVINARCFEAMLCGALYLVQESKEMDKLYSPDTDFVDWSSKEELLEIIRQLLSKPEILTEKALSGQKKTEERYSAKTFWDKVL